MNYLQRVKIMRKIYIQIQDNLRYRQQCLIVHLVYTELSRLIIYGHL